MEETYPAFAVREVTPLRNLDYYYYVLRQIELAEQRIWISMFIIEVARAGDPYLEVRSLIHKLSEAVRVGIDVKVLSGRSRDIVSITETNVVSHKFMATKGIPVTAYRSRHRAGQHNKYVIFDNDTVVIGSHNWTHLSFRESEEDSLAINSVDLNNRLAMEFLEDWRDSLRASGWDSGW